MCATGTSLSQAKFTSSLLAGLSSDYDPFVTFMIAQLEPMTSEELYSLLLTHESHFAHSNHLPVTTDLSANLTTTPSFHGRGSCRGNNRGGHRGHSKGRAILPYTPYPPNASLHHSKPTCQVCGKIGHVALKCYYCFDHAYQSDHSHSLITNYSSSLPSHDQSWYPDTATTNHITSDLANLNITSGPYGGNEQIRIGDGKELPIANIGDSKFSNSSHSFILKNLLHVLSITKNLISV